MARSAFNPSALSRAARRVSRPTWAWVLLGVILAAVGPAFGQDEFDKPLLPDAISSDDIELYGRYANQWRQDDGTLVVMFTGGFRLEMGQRQLAADAAVVWITPLRDESDGRRYYELTVYLSGSAEVHELGGRRLRIGCCW